MKKIFTLFAAAMLTMGAMAQNKNVHFEYDGTEVPAGSGYQMGDKDIITLTFIMGEEASDQTWTSGTASVTDKDLSGNEISYTNYVQAKSTNGRTNILTNRNCAYFQFEPKYSGTIQVMAQNVGTNKNIVAGNITGGEYTALPTQVYNNGIVNLAADGKLEEVGINENYNGYVNFAVEAGKTYVFCVGGSKGRIMGFSFTYDSNSTSAITDIAADENAPVKYFNLQGIRVDNPTSGLYIKRQGSKVTKVIM